MVWCLRLSLSCKAEGDSRQHGEAQGQGHTQGRRWGWFEEHLDQVLVLEIEWGELQPCLRTWVHSHRRQKELLNMVKYKVSSATIQLLRNRNCSTSLVAVAKMDGPENPILTQQI